MIVRLIHSPFDQAGEFVELPFRSSLPDRVTKELVTEMRQPPDVPTYEFDPTRGMFVLRGLRG